VFVPASIAQSTGLPIVEHWAVGMRRLSVDPEPAGSLAAVTKCRGSRSRRGRIGAGRDSRRPRSERACPHAAAEVCDPGMQLRAWSREETGPRVRSLLAVVDPAEAQGRCARPYQGSARRF
jgi:hypothetical protein